MTTFLSPALRPVTPSSKPGMNCFLPMTRLAPSPEPPSNVSPSTRPTKFMVTRSPSPAARPSSGSKAVFRSARSDSALSIAASSTSATSRSSFNVLRSATGIGGKTSNDILYARSASPLTMRSNVPSFTSTSSTLGCCAGRSLRSLMTLALVSLSVCSITSCISDLP